MALVLHEKVENIRKASLLTGEPFSNSFSSPSIQNKKKKIYIYVCPTYALFTWECVYILYMYIDFTYTFSSVEGLFWPKRVFVPFFLNISARFSLYCAFFVVFFSEEKNGKCKGMLLKLT